MMDFPRELLEGFGSYRKNAYQNFKEDYENLAAYGQNPEVMVISCCDSRVTPEMVFDAPPGGLFVTRNVANLVPPMETDENHHGTSASIEYAVTALKVKHIVILGHCKCGGVQAFRTSGGDVSGTGMYIGPWIKMLEPAAVSIACDPIDRDIDPQLGLEYAGIRQSLKNLLTFSFVQDAIKSGQLKLHGAWFDIGSGSLRIMNPETKVFEPAEDLMV